MAVAARNPGIVPYRDLARIRHEHLLRKIAIRTRLGDFASVHPDEYFYELLYCLFTPQSNAVNASKAVDVLRTADFLHAGGIDTIGILRTKAHYIRFHNTKARHAAEAKQRLPEILDRVAPGNVRAPNENGPAIRAWLATHVAGLGWKESSHFLRNIGFLNLAILDRHILKNLHHHGAVSSLPTTLTAKRYLAIEKAFETFARAISISMDELDLLFWSRETGEIRK